MSIGNDVTKATSELCCVILALIKIFEDNDQSFLCFCNVENRFVYVHSMTAY